MAQTSRQYPINTNAQPIQNREARRAGQNGRMSREDIIEYSEQSSGSQGMHWLLNDAFAILIGLAGAAGIIWVLAFLF